MQEIVDSLFELKDEKFADFQSKLIPTVPREKIIGVRTPALRAYGKSLGTDAAKVDAFKNELPHYYYEENALHGFLISAEKKDIRKLFSDLDRFLPYVDNWAVCDTMSPKLFAKYPDEAYEQIKQYLKSDNIYTVRFGIVSLLQFFLDKNFRPESPYLVAAVKSGEYYVDMACAWYFSFALIKRFEETLPMIESRTLDKFVHNKSIQKAVESYRIDGERKNYLKTLKIF